MKSESRVGKTLTPSHYMPNGGVHLCTYRCTLETHSPIDIEAIITTLGSSYRPPRKTHTLMRKPHTTAGETRKIPSYNSMKIRIYINIKVELRICYISRGS